MGRTVTRVTVCAILGATERRRNQRVGVQSFRLLELRGPNGMIRRHYPRAVPRKSSTPRSHFATGFTSPSASRCQLMQSSVAFLRSLNTCLSQARRHLRA